MQYAGGILRQPAQKLVATIIYSSLVTEWVQIRPQDGCKSSHGTDANPATGREQIQSQDGRKSNHGTGTNLVTDPNEKGLLQNRATVPLLLHI